MKQPQPHPPTATPDQPDPRDPSAATVKLAILDSDTDFVGIIPSRLALMLDEVSTSLAEVTECLRDLEAPESWDPAHADPSAALHRANRNLRQDAIMARLQAENGEPEEPEDAALADAACDVFRCLSSPDHRSRRAAILSGWQDWPSAEIRNASLFGRYADRIVCRLYFRLTCYQDALAGPQVWPLELVDPEGASAFEIVELTE